MEFSGNTSEPGSDLISLAPSILSFPSHLLLYPYKRHGKSQQFDLDFSVSDPVLSTLCVLNLLMFPRMVYSRTPVTRCRRLNNSPQRY